VWLNPLLKPAELAAYYPPSYYGQTTQQKFTLSVELIVRLTNRLHASILIKHLSKKPALHHAECKVLDIGCGRGHLLRALHARGFDCYGTEIPSYPLPDSMPRLTFKSGMLENLALEPQSFSAISIWHVLEHTPDPGQVMKQVANLLK